MMERAEGEVAIDIYEAVVSSASRKLVALSDKPLASDNFTIFRVPAHVRQRNKHLYEPQMVVIGPYGRRDEPSLRVMEQLKWRYLLEFLSRSGPVSINDYVAEIQKLEPAARRCYFEPVELETVEFVEMLLLDGCFILEFLIKWNRGDRDDLFVMEWSLPLVRGDLLLLENQIPLFVLEKLFELHTTMETPASKGKMCTLMELLVNYLVKIYHKRPNKEVEGREDKKFDHLLHLYYHCNVTTPQTDPTHGTICGNILELFWPRRIFTSLLSNICTKHRMKRLPWTIPSATELLEAGVTIKKKNRRSSFLDVTFYDGVLEIPFFSVDNSTLSRLMNDMAFEQCGRCKPEAAYVTSYATFMDCLINTPGDVAILHERGVLENQLASDQELAVFFNHLSDCAVIDFERHYLARLFREVGEYCDSDWHKWRAKVIRDYFTYPWPIISLSVATVILISTFVQAFFAVYSYYHPRN